MQEEAEPNEVMATSAGPQSFSDGVKEPQISNAGENSLEQWADEVLGGQHLSQKTTSSAPPESALGSFVDKLKEKLSAREPGHEHHRYQPQPPINLANQSKAILPSVRQINVKTSVMMPSAHHNEVETIPDVILIEDELNRWNWGAFFLNWIWAISHRVWIGLLAVLPIGPWPLIMCLILGRWGSRWAWKRRYFNDLAEFKAAQRTWARWGLIIFVLNVLVMIFTINWFLKVNEISLFKSS